MFSSEVIKSFDNSIVAAHAVVERAGRLATLNSQRVTELNRQFDNYYLPNLRNGNVELERIDTSEDPVPYLPPAALGEINNLMGISGKNLDSFESVGFRSGSAAGFLDCNIAVSGIVSKTIRHFPNYVTLLSNSPELLPERLVHETIHVLQCFRATADLADHPLPLEHTPYRHKISRSNLAVMREAEAYSVQLAVLKDTSRDEQIKSGIEKSIAMQNNPDATPADTWKKICEMESLGIINFLIEIGGISATKQPHASAVTILGALSAIGSLI